MLGFPATALDSQHRSGGQAAASSPPACSPLAGHNSVRQCFELGCRPCFPNQPLDRSHPPHSAARPVLPPLVRRLSQAFPLIVRRLESALKHSQTIAARPTQSRPPHWIRLGCSLDQTLRESVRLKKYLAKCYSPNPSKQLFPPLPKDRTGLLPRRPSARNS